MPISIYSQRLTRLYRAYLQDQISDRTFSRLVDQLVHVEAEAPAGVGAGKSCLKSVAWLPLHLQEQGSGQTVNRLF